MNKIYLEIWNLLLHQGDMAPLETAGDWKKNC